MTPLPMTMTHQHAEPWTARLEPAAALTLRAAPEPRALAVHEGRVWATRRVDRGRAEDLWLAAGDLLELPPGSEWVLEAWPAARVSLLAALPQAGPTGSLSGGFRAGGRLGRDAAGPRLAWWRRLPMAERWAAPALPR